MLVEDRDASFAEVRQWVRDLRDSAAHRETMEIAVLLREISSRGDTERTLCRELLEAVLKFSDSKSDTSFLNY
jgi:hypothetical protein